MECDFRNINWSPRQIFVGLDFYSNFLNFRSSQSILRFWGKPLTHRQYLIGVSWGPIVWGSFMERPTILFIEFLFDIFWEVFENGVYGKKISRKNRKKFEKLSEVLAKIQYFSLQMTPI